ncbi:MAG: energy transducer TonB [Sphingomonadaceae bacterium]
MMEYEGPGATSLTYIKWANGDRSLMLTNSGWTAKAGMPYNVTYSLDGVSFSGGSVGATVSYKSGFFAKFNDEFETHFARGATLWVYLDEELIDQLSLNGSAIALKSVNRCLASVREKIIAAQREKERWSHIPKDPFSKDTGVLRDQARKNALLLPLSNPDSWTALSDYPSRALRERREGKTSVTLTVGVAGNVTSCRVIKSSGHADLDHLTCDLLSRRAKFSPATDEEGRPIVASYPTMVNWSLP